MHNHKYENANNTAKSVTPKKIKKKIGFSPKSFYKTSSQGAKISKLISDANNSFTLKRNRSKCDLNTKLFKDKNSVSPKEVKKSSVNDSIKSNKKCNNLVSEKTSNLKEKRIKKISNNANQYSFSGKIVKNSEVKHENEKCNKSSPLDTSQIVPKVPQKLSQVDSKPTVKPKVGGNDLEHPKPQNIVKNGCKRRASEADLVNQNSHDRIKSHKRSKSSSSRRRNDISQIMTNYQNRLLQQRHQDHQNTVQKPQTSNTSPVKNTMCNIIRPAKLTNVTPTKFPSISVPIQVQQTIVKSTNRQSIIVLPPNHPNASQLFPTQQQINTTYNKQMIMVPSPNTQMSSQLPAFYHHQSEVRTSFTSNIIVPSSPAKLKVNQLSTINNPFLPTSSVKSSFLFGNNDDFETADAEDLAIDDEVILAMGSESSSEESDEEEDEDHIIYSPIDEDAIFSLDEERESPVSLKKSLNSSLEKTCIPNNVSHQIKLDSSKDIKNTTSFKTEPAQKDKKLDIKDVCLSTEACASEKSIKVLPKINHKNSVKECENVLNKKIRFPAAQGPNNMIECKWLGCEMSFTTYGRLSDHLKVTYFRLL